MANLNEQIVRIWDEWSELTGSNTHDPDEFIDWAVSEGKISLYPEDVRKIYRRRVSGALRQVRRIDENGTEYRGHQTVAVVEDGVARTLFFDVDKGGTPLLRQKAVKQRREAIANDVYRAMSDVEHMNFAYPEDEPIQFVMDFTEDYEERKAIEALEREEQEKDAG